MIRQRALDLGFGAVGFARAEKLKHLEKPFNDWLEQGFHGNMSWLEINLDKRLDPTVLLEGAKTVISLIAWYYDENYLPGCGISRYATGRDYHKVLKKKGKELLHYISELTGSTNGRVFVDSAPVMEREWARMSGLGWIGKNGCLIQPRKGSWFFLSEIILDIDLPPDPPETADLCGSCNRCVRACPTGALLGNGLLDARRCISYLTIEIKANQEKPTDLSWDDWFFGCDICQDVCPWNRQPLSRQMEDLKPRAELLKLREMLDIQSAPGDELSGLIQGTPLNRAGSEKLLKNFQWIQPDAHQKEPG